MLSSLKISKCPLALAILVVIEFITPSYEVVGPEVSSCVKHIEKPCLKVESLHKHPEDWGDVSKHYHG